MLKYKEKYIKYERKVWFKKKFFRLIFIFKWHLHKNGPIKMLFGGTYITVDNNVRFLLGKFINRIG